MQSVLTQVHALKTDKPHSRPIDSAISVCVRFRPPNQLELESGGYNSVQIGPATGSTEPDTTGVFARLRVGYVWCDPELYATLQPKDMWRW